MSSSIVAPSGQTPATTTAQDTAFLKAQVERAQSMQTFYLVLAGLAFIVAFVQTVRLRRLLGMAAAVDPWAGWGGGYYR
jgi:hypothetical protein